MEVFGQRPCDTEPVEGTGTPPHLIQQNKRFRSGIIENIGRFVHLDQKSALPCSQVIGSSYPGKNFVNQTDFSFFCRHKRSQDRKSTRLNSSHVAISYAVFCLKKKNSKQ